MILFKLTSYFLQWNFRKLFFTVLTCLFFASFNNQAQDKQDAHPWPFDPVALKILRQSPRKVYAHWHVWPIVWDKQPEEFSLYSTGGLEPAGYRGRWKKCGGKIREKTLPELQDRSDEWLMKNAKTDVRLASEAGLDGFVANFNEPKGPFYQRIMALFDAATVIDPGFRFILSPNAYKHDPQGYLDFVKRFENHPATLRVDGKIAVSPWGANNKKPVSYWKEFMSLCKADGFDVALMPCTHAGLWKDNGKWVKQMAPFLYGLTDSATWKYPGDLTPKWSQRAHDLGIKIWLQNIRPQHSRPKAGFYFECGGSEQLRRSWEMAITQGHPDDWVHIFTYNDLSEASGFRPSTAIQYSFYDLMAYYITWLKTGKRPAVVRDVLYYFHRQHSIKATPDPKYQKRKWKCRGGTPQDIIELLAFLKEPGTIQIKVGKKTYTRKAPAGITSFKVPVTEGRPEFKLIRDNKTEIHCKSKWVISNDIVWENYSYYGGSSSRERDWTSLAPEPAGCELHLALNQTWGPVNYDFSGHKRHAHFSEYIASGISPVQGVHGNGRHFKAKSRKWKGAHLETGAFPTLATDEFTACLWVNPTGKIKGRLLSQTDKKSNSGFYLGRLKNGGFGLSLKRAGKTVTIRSRKALPSGKWSFVAAVINRDTAKLYINGKVAGKVAFKVPATKVENSKVLIGKGYAGRIDEIRLYRRALTEKEISILCNYNNI